MKCQQYFAKKDENGFPIPGTMMGFTGQPGTCGFNYCDLVELPSSTYQLQAGDTQLFHPMRLRFFVVLDSKGRIRPNSLMSSFKVPHGVRTAEFIKYIPAA